jgi:hypothetical protein
MLKQPTNLGVYLVELQLGNSPEAEGATCSLLAIVYKILKRSDRTQFHLTTLPLRREN